AFAARARAQLGRRQPDRSRRRKPGLGEGRARPPVARRESAMRIAVAREVDPAEDRVAATPETVKTMQGLGAEVVVEPGAGTKSGIPDAEFTAAGASVRAGAASGADIVLKVRRPAAAELAGCKKGALVIAIMDPYGQEAALKASAEAGATASAMQLMPRITRAQVMD